MSHAQAYEPLLKSASSLISKCEALLADNKDGDNEIDKKEVFLKSTELDNNFLKSDELSERLVLEDKRDDSVECKIQFMVSNLTY